MGPNGPPNKMGPKWAPMGPNKSKMGPKWAQMGPKQQGPQMGPKWAPNHEPPTGPMAPPSSYTPFSKPPDFAWI